MKDLIDKKVMIELWFQYMMQYPEICPQGAPLLNVALLMIVMQLTEVEIPFPASKKLQISTQDKSKYDYILQSS